MGQIIEFLIWFDFDQFKLSSCWESRHFFFVDDLKTINHCKVELATITDFWRRGRQNFLDYIYILEWDHALANAGLLGLMIVGQKSARLLWSNNIEKRANSFGKLASSNEKKV